MTHESLFTFCAAPLSIAGSGRRLIGAGSESVGKSTIRQTGRSQTQRSNLRKAGLPTGGEAKTSLKQGNRQGSDRGG